MRGLAWGPLTIRLRLGAALVIALMPVLALGAVHSWNEFRSDAQAQTRTLTLAAQRSAVLARARVQASAAVRRTRIVLNEPRGVRAI